MRSRCGSLENLSNINRQIVFSRLGRGREQGHLAKLRVQVPGAGMTHPMQPILAACQFTFYNSLLLRADSVKIRLSHMKPMQGFAHSRVWLDRS